MGFLVQSSMMLQQNFSVCLFIWIYVHLDYFTFSAEGVRNNRLSFNLLERDRIITWFLSLFLVLNDFKIFVSTISADLCFTENVVIKTLTALGCV